MNIIRILPGVYNEADIIEENIEFYGTRGIPSAVIDNGSDDGTYEICKRRTPGDVIALERVVTEGFDLHILLRAASLLYKSLKPDWVVMADADEFIEPMAAGETMMEAVREADSNRYTVIPTHVAHFRMTEKDDPRAPGVLGRLLHYAVETDGGHEKIWKDSPYVDLFHPHAPFFFDKREKAVSPKHCIVRHYPLRSIPQIRRKQSRIRPSPNDPFGWHIHYLNMEENDYVADSGDLCRYGEDGRWDLSKRYPHGYFDMKSVIRYYASRGQEHLGVLIEELKSTTESEEELLLLLAEVHRVRGETEKSREYLREARRLTAERLNEIDRLMGGAE